QRVRKRYNNNVVVPISGKSGIAIQAISPPCPETVARKAQEKGTRPYLSALPGEAAASGAAGCGRRVGSGRIGFRNGVWRQPLAGHDAENARSSCRVLGAIAAETGRGG